MLWWAAIAATAGAATTGIATAQDAEQPTRLRAAALEFAVTPEAGGSTGGKTGALVRRVAGPLKSTVTLLEDGDLRLCLVTMHFNSTKAANVSPLLRRAVAEELKVPFSHVLLCVSHNHTDLKVAHNQLEAYETIPVPSEGLPEPKLTPIGAELLRRLRETARRLPALLQPATVWWAEGSEGRITYNRKGRRADGSTYFMREEDRDLLGTDYNGDIDRQAPIVVLKNARDEPIAAVVQFTGHPCTAYHPEKPIVTGDWPQVACDVVGRGLSPTSPPAVAFLQGCAGDVNSKGMLRGGVELSERYGLMLAESYLRAAGGLRRSTRDGLDYAVERVEIPLGPLPSAEALRAEIAEMNDFIRRAAAGDENTPACVGQNFPQELSPAYRGKIVETILPWSRWALGLRETGRADTVAKHLDVEIQVIRLGDVGIVCLPFEPFQGIGRQIRAGSPLPLTIPCGYTNVSYGYLTDGPNTGDREYMSAHYRYSKFRPPYREPAGDAAATKAVETLQRLAK